MIETRGKKLPIVDIAQLLEKPSSSFVATMLGWTFFVILLDGFDFGSLTFAAPVLMKELDATAQMFGVIFSAGIFGIMLGSILFGFIGDKFGRKRALFISCLWFGLLTLGTVFATSMRSLLILRFFAGIGIGGAVPSAIVLVSEYAPKKSKVKWVTIMFTGYTVGSAVGGIVSAWLIPLYGWQSIFVVGGVLPLLAAIGSARKLPESLRFLALKPENHDEIVAIVERVRPELAIEANSNFVMGDEAAAHKKSDFSYKMLFSGILFIVTPVIWLFYISNSLAVYFLQSWLPVLFVSLGTTVSHAAYISAVWSIGGTVGGLCLAWIIDRFGMLSGTTFPLCGILTVAILGHISNINYLTVDVFFIGFFVTGTQFILTACTPLFYPTAIRTQADGTAIAVAKIGSISGPIVGGLLIGMKLPLYEIFYVLAIPVVIATVLCFTQGKLYQTHFSLPSTLPLNTLDS
jgi:AAHS family 4-hydroxybenzoate transporter-like MFS transporter